VDLKLRIAAAYLLIVVGILSATAAALCVADCAVVDATADVASVKNSGHCQNAGRVGIADAACDPHSPVAVQSSLYVSPKFHYVSVDLAATGHTLLPSITVCLSLAEAGTQCRAPSSQPSHLTSLRI
jgi:hypothetical protein